MSYTISEVAKLMGISAHTLRYYDKVGLLPNVKRVNGIRVFEDEDFKWLRVLNCLKNTNMPIKKIKEFVDLMALGDSTLQSRYELIKEQRRNVEEEIKQLQYYLQELDYKDWYYQTAIKYGSEAAVEKYSRQEPTLELDECPKEVNKSHK